MRSRFIPAVALAVVGAVAIDCGGISDPSQNVTEPPFTGTIPVKGSGPLHQFSVSSTGEYTVKLNTLTPVTGTQIGINLYTGDATCTSGSLQLFGSNSALPNVQALGGRIFSGHYCLVAYDLGFLTVATTYSITVSHP
ncbi:MAG: hypothetical protein HY047_02445 [Acidobacteria bacterium]|nr:hypothetical protein [Acidobacteriota bacterium]